MLAGVVVIGDVVAMLLLAVEATGVGVGGVTTPRGDVGLPHKRKATSPAATPCTDEGSTGSRCRCYYETECCTQASTMPSRMLSCAASRGINTGSGLAQTRPAEAAAPHGDGLPSRHRPLQGLCSRCSLPDMKYSSWPEGLILQL